MDGPRPSRAWRPCRPCRAYGVPGTGKDLVDQALQLGDRRSQHGLDTSHESQIVYTLDGRHDRFRAWVGLDVVVRERGTASFHVLVRRP